MKALAKEFTVAVCVLAAFLALIFSSWSELDPEACARAWIAEHHSSHAAAPVTCEPDTDGLAQCWTVIEGKTITLRCAVRGTTPKRACELASR